MKNSKYAHLVKLCEQAISRISAGEPASNLVRIMQGNTLSEGVAWTYPHERNLFSLDEATYWTAEYVNEREADDRDNELAEARYQQRVNLATTSATAEQLRRSAMTDIERMVEDAVISSPQFRAFVANRSSSQV